MRLLVVAHNYPRVPGDPAGAYVARLARAAAQTGATVEILVPHTRRAPYAEDTAGIRVHRFRYAPAALERVGYRGDARPRAFLSPLTAVVVPAYLVRFRQALRHTAFRFNPDVIHAHWWFPAGWLVSRLGRPFLVTCHGSDVRLLDRSALLRRMARTVLERAAAVTTVSRFLAHDVTRWVGGLARPVVVTPMPVDVDLFSTGLTVPKAAPSRILYAGNLVATKGVDLLIEALAQLRARGVACRLRIVGEGPAGESLRRLARELGVTDLVDWSPFVPQDRMPAEYGAATVTTLPTRGGAEGLGLTLVEALVAGSAVVGARTGGIPEVVRHEETGLLARDDDPADLATQIERLLTDPALRARLTQAGRARAIATYSTAAAARPFLELYHALADRQPAS